MICCFVYFRPIPSLKYLESQRSLANLPWANNGLNQVNVALEGSPKFIIMSFSGVVFDELIITNNISRVNNLLNSLSKLYPAFLNMVTCRDKVLGKGRIRRPLGGTPDMAKRQRKDARVAGTRIPKNNVIARLYRSRNICRRSPGLSWIGSTSIWRSPLFRPKNC